MKVGVAFVVVLLLLVQFLCIALGIQWFYEWFISGIFQDLPSVITYRTAVVITVVCSLFMSLFQVSYTKTSKKSGDGSAEVGESLGRIFAIWSAIGLGYATYWLLF